MIAWSEFADWLKVHDLPETAVLKIELVPCHNGMHIRAKTLVLDEAGRSIARELPDDTDPGRAGSYLTEILVRPLVSLPDAPSADHADCIALTEQETRMSAITDKVRALVAALEAEGHHLADEARQILAKLHGDETTLQAEAATDLHQVETDAAPVIAEAKADAQALATEAAADVKDATSPASPAA